MKKNSMVLFFVTMLVIFTASCSGNLLATDKPKVLAIVDNVEITQEQVEEKKQDSMFSQQETNFSDREVLDVLIEEQLLLLESKELDISMSDDDVRQAYKEMRQCMSSKEYTEGEEDSLDKEEIAAFRDVFIIEKTKQALGSDLERTLEQLRENVKITYKTK